MADSKQGLASFVTFEFVDTQPETPIQPLHRPVDNRRQKIPRRGAQTSPADRELRRSFPHPKDRKAVKKRIKASQPALIKAAATSPIKPSNPKSFEQAAKEWQEAQENARRVLSRHGPAQTAPDPHAAAGIFGLTEATGLESSPQRQLTEEELLKALTMSLKVQPPSVSRTGKRCAAAHRFTHRRGQLSTAEHNRRSESKLAAGGGERGGSGGVGEEGGGGAVDILDQVEVLKHIFIREQQLRRLRALVTQLESDSVFVLQQSAPLLALRAGDGVEQERYEKRVLTMGVRQHLLHALLAQLRASSIAVATAVTEWRARWRRKDRRALRLRAVHQFMWRGSNYVTKMGRDTAFLEGTVHVRAWLGFPVVGNPLLIPPRGAATGQTRLHSPRAHLAVRAAMREAAAAAAAEAAAAAAAAESSDPFFSDAVLLPPTAAGGGGGGPAAIVPSSTSASSVVGGPTAAAAASVGGGGLGTLSLPPVLELPEAAVPTLSSMPDGGGGGGATGSGRNSVPGSARLSGRVSARGGGGSGGGAAAADSAAAVSAAAGGMGGMGGAVDGLLAGRRAMRAGGSSSTATSALTSADWGELLHGGGSGSSPAAAAAAAAAPNRCTSPTPSVAPSTVLVPQLSEEERAAAEAAAAVVLGEAALVASEREREKEERERMRGAYDPMASLARRGGAAGVLSELEATVGNMLSGSGGAEARAALVGRAEEPTAIVRAGMEAPPTLDGAPPLRPCAARLQKAVEGGRVKRRVGTHTASILTDRSLDADGQERPLSQAEAATIVRRRRGMKGALMVRKGPRVRRTVPQPKRRSEAAVRIQCVARGMLTRRRGRLRLLQRLQRVRQQKAASHLQRIVRGHLGRVEARGERQRVGEEEAEARAVTRIQSLFRGMVGRRRAELEMVRQMGMDGLPQTAAVAMQLQGSERRAARSEVVRREEAAMRRAVWEARQAKGSVRVNARFQSTNGKVAVGRSAAAMQAAALTIQCMLRCAFARAAMRGRRQRLEAERAARAIQLSYRYHRDYEILKEKRRRLRAQAQAAALSPDSPQHNNNNNNNNNGGRRRKKKKKKTGKAVKALPQQRRQRRRSKQRLRGGRGGPEEEHDGGGGGGLPAIRAGGVRDDERREQGRRGRGGGGGAALGPRSMRRQTSMSSSARPAAGGGVEGRGGGLRRSDSNMSNGGSGGGGRRSRGAGGRGSSTLPSGGLPAVGGGGSRRGGGRQRQSLALGRGRVGLGH